MKKSHIHRTHVIRTVRPWATESALESLKQDLKIEDWMAEGSGDHSLGNGDILIVITQTDDLEYFDIEIS